MKNLKVWRAKKMSTQYPFAITLGIKGSIRRKTSLIITGLHDQFL